MEMSLSDDRRVLVRLLHEIKVPLAVINGAVEFIEHELQQKKIELTYDYTGDIRSWCDLMRRIIVNAEVYSSDGVYRPAHFEPTLLFRAVVMPAIRQIKPLLRERGFSRRNIVASGFESIPALFVDRNLMVQVIFNLLSNSIKYAFDDPNAFAIEILASLDDLEYIILYRDWGPGINKDWQEKIFEEGTRGPDSQEKNVSGDGLGLWVVRQIMQAHNGSIRLSLTGMPTEFRLKLPLSKSCNPPSSERIST